MRRAFTLIELLVVIVIVGILIGASVAMFGGLSHRQTSEGARILQGALVGARDDAIHTGAPSGIRLLPDPAFPLLYLPNGQLDPNQPLAANRIIPIRPAPDYSEGTVARFPGTDYSSITPLPCLVAEEGVGRWLQNAPGDPYHFEIDSPTGWYWNIRIGDKLQINGVGNWYTIVGPMVIGPSAGNSELFVNVGPVQTAPPWSRTLTSPDGQSITVKPQFLFLVNGRDDNNNGWIDEGFDGVDNNANGQVDELAEWESERWPS
jgi:prepilin-type N-terminal cleavage/methylation domain-containing protein